MKASAASAVSDHGTAAPVPGAGKPAPHKPAARKAAPADLAVVNGSADAVTTAPLTNDHPVAAQDPAADAAAEPPVEAGEVAAEDLKQAVAPPLIEDDEDEDDAAPPGASRATPSHGSGHGQRNGMGMMNGRPPQISRASNKDETFAEGDHVVYPTHGVGRVEKIAVEEIAGHRLELIHITFEENRMTLRVPVAKARSAGLRKLATRKLFDEALAVLKGRARIKRTMWSRRAQEYEAKINSGDPLAIAEVVRDLHRNSGQPDQSFSERQIYEAAMDRLAAELAALDQTDKTTASVKLTNYLKTIS
jgi:CarD family transcriptional regulator